MAKYTRRPVFVYLFRHYTIPPLPPPDCVRLCSMIVHWPRRPKSLPSLQQKWKRPLSSKQYSRSIAASICCFCGHQQHCSSEGSQTVRHEKKISWFSSLAIIQQTILQRGSCSIMVVELGNVEHCTEDLDFNRCANIGPRKV